MCKPLFQVIGNDLTSKVLPDSHEDIDIEYEVWELFLRKNEIR
jgi:hypothetical protein